jgi:glucoamylase
MASVYKIEGMFPAMFSSLSFFRRLLIMYLLAPSVAAACLLCSQVIGAPAEVGARDLGSFISQEKAFALRGVLNNIGPDGSAVPGAAAGFVVASPSKENPNC